jgi:glyoxylase-like metal-dependent hydrolase (beta-lactamase superfamily II)
MREIAAGVRQLPGYPRDLFNIYLVGDVLVDAGTRWARGRVLSRLEYHPPRLVLLTHCHPDHQGVAKAVCDRFGVPLACHAADVAAVEGRAPMQPDRPIIRLGVRVWAGPPCPVGRVLHEGDEVAGFRVVHAPGHTPGHIILFRDSDRVAIAGDVLANMHFLSGRPGLRLPPPAFCSDFAENRRSVLKLAGLRPSLVCFGHGPPLREPDVLHAFADRLRQRV